MAQQEISITQEFSSDVQHVFAALADHNRLSQVLGVPVKRIKDGSGDINGVGSVRRIGPWPLGTQETVTAFEPGQHIAYRISRLGGPVLNHQGSLQFEPADQGCRVTWQISFDTLPAALGPGLRQLLEMAVSHGLRKLARQGA